MKNKDRTIILTLLVIAVVVILACIFVTVIPVNRTPKAQQYELKCLTEPNRKPLEECIK